MKKGGKVWSCGKQFFIFLRCSMILFDCPEIKSQQSKNILRMPYEPMKISGNFNKVTHKFATGRGE